MTSELNENLDSKSVDTKQHDNLLEDFADNLLNVTWTPVTLGFGRSKRPWPMKLLFVTYTVLGIAKRLHK